MPYDKITDPAETRVVIPVRVPWRAREELHALADERHQSLNLLLLEAIESALGVVMR